MSAPLTRLLRGMAGFMDADYGRIRNRNGDRLDQAEWQNALFIKTGIMSKARPGIAVCDAGLKVMSTDSGLPTIFGRDDVTYRACNDEHGIIDDPDDALSVNDSLWLVPGHCDPTCNLHDCYVVIKGGKVETLWPIIARGRAL